MPVKKEKSTQSVKDLALLGINYANNKKEIKHLEAECTKMRKPLESYLEEEGHVLESGSKLAILPYVDVEVHLKKTLRTGKVLLPEAMEVLEKNGLSECIENVPIIREDVIEALYYEGKITDELLMKIYKSKPTFAFSVEVKHSTPDEPE